MDSISYAEIFTTCTGLNISEHTQELRICDLCEITLLESYKFRLQCIESYTILTTKNVIDFDSKTTTTDKETNEETNEELTFTEIKEEEVLSTNDNDMEDDLDNTDIYMETVVGHMPIIKLSDNSQYITKSRKISKIYQCSYCPKTFLLSQSASRVLHERRYHTKEKPFKCIYGCENKSFFTKSILNTHIRKNHRPYTCKICNENILTKEELELHSKTHTNPKANQCDICGIQFFIEKSYLKHIESHKKDIIDYPCNICNAPFSQKRHLVKHISENHRKNSKKD